MFNKSQFVVACQINGKLYSCITIQQIEGGRTTATIQVLHFASRKQVHVHVIFGMLLCEDLLAEAP